MGALTGPKIRCVPKTAMNGLWNQISCQGLNWTTWVARNYISPSLALVSSTVSLFSCSLLSSKQDIPRLEVWHTHSVKGSQDSKQHPSGGLLPHSLASLCSNTLAIKLTMSCMQHVAQIRFWKWLAHFCVTCQNQRSSSFLPLCAQGCVWGILANLFNPSSKNFSMRSVFKWGWMNDSSVACVLIKDKEQGPHETGNTLLNKNECLSMVSGFLVGRHDQGTSSSFSSA